MSAPLQVIKDHYAASGSGDLDAMLSCLAPDAQWTEMAGFPYAGTYTGRDGVKENVFMRIGAEWDNYQAAPETFVADGDQVVAFGVYSGTYRATGKYMQARFVHHWQLRDGMVVRFEQYTDTKLVADAMS
ncbi:MAG: nuclear transport factor 2 family protein [Jatrophihabitantaceae bacterium]